MISGMKAIAHSVPKKVFPPKISLRRLQICAGVHTTCQHIRRFSTTVYWLLVMTYWNGRLLQTFTWIIITVTLFSF